jgi:hypothetical protein
MIMRVEFTGMLPGAIEKFEQLMTRLAALNPRIVDGFSSHGDENDLRTWGVVCNIECDDEKVLLAESAGLGITVQADGSLAYTGGMTINDFKTCRVQADLTLAPEMEE